MPDQAINLNTRGVTLVELLAAVTIIVSVVAAVTAFFPKASRAIASNRQRLVATQMAQTLLQQSTKLPYALLDPTPDNSINFPSGSSPPGIGNAAGDCDCNFANYSVLPGASNVIVNNVTYNQSTCITYADPISLQSYCLGAVTGGFIPDPGLKTVHVRVWWNVANTPLAVDIASKVARL